MKQIQEAFAKAEPFDIWPELIALDGPDLPTLDPTWLPSWAGAFAAALAANTETPPELAAAMILAACSTACARRLRVRVGPDYFEPTNLWLLCALPPGSRKSAVQAAAVAPVLDWEREQAAKMKVEITRVTSEVETMQARAKEFRVRAAKAELAAESADFAEQARVLEASIPELPRMPQLWTSDATPEHLGTLMANNGEHMARLSSEGGIFDTLGGRYSNGVPNLDLTLKAHSGDADRVDRGSRPPIFLRRPLLTVGLSPQPDVLRGLATKRGFRGRGLLARFLYLMPRSNLGHRTYEAAPTSESTRQQYADGVRAMLSWPLDVDPNGTPVPHILDLTADARAEWLDFARHVEREMLPGGAFEHTPEWAAKAPGAAVRLAAVLHGIEHAHDVPWAAPIDGSTMATALELIPTALWIDPCP